MILGRGLPGRPSSTILKDTILKVDDLKGQAPPIRDSVDLYLQLS